jgi:opine dehydrogenase
MIGARREFLDPVEMADFNGNLVKVLAITGAFRKLQLAVDLVIDQVKAGKKGAELVLPKIVMTTDKAVEGEFTNNYALAKARAAHEIAITTRAVRLPTGVFPERLAPHALAVLGRAFPGAIEPCGDALSAALMNGGPTIHAPLIVMNAGAIDRFARGGPDFDIHNEGTQPAVRRVTDALDAERIALREALGYGAPHFPLADHYRRDGELWMYPRLSHADLHDSNDWRETLDLTRHRYMAEDTLMGLPLLLSVARLTGTDMPLTAAFAAIGRAVSGLPFGRSLGAVGLGGLDLPSLRKVLHDGFA